MTPCRVCGQPAVTASTTVEDHLPGQPIGVSYLCELHDIGARTMRLQDRQLRAGGFVGLDVIVADLRAVSP